MASINLCDRCDTMYTGSCASYLSISINGAEESVTADLCPGCVNDIRKILVSKPTTDRPTAYRTFPVEETPDEETQRLALDKNWDVEGNRHNP